MRRPFRQHGIRHPDRHALVRGFPRRPVRRQRGEWRSYGGEEGSTRYSPLDQITRDNVKNLKVAWTWKFDNFGTAPEAQDRDRRRSW